jgi:CRISPR system Cascade subunit CasB
MPGQKTALILKNISGINQEGFVNKNELLNEDYFVRSIINRIKNDKACCATLRRADNQSTEYQSWEYLAIFGIDLSKPLVRLPYATIAAAIAKAKPAKNGSDGIGRAIAHCYPDGNKSDQAKAKLRRLLACDTLEEICRILRPLFSLIEAKSSIGLNFSRLLRELLKFQWKEQEVKSNWAQDFYGHQAEESEEQ